MGTGRPDSVSVPTRKIKRRIAQLEEELVELRELERASDSRKVFKCGKCGKGTQLKNLTYTQTHWYESPSGCTGGDLWHSGEGNITCPKCGCRNRLIREYGESFVQHKHLFGNIADDYDDEHRGRYGEEWVNV